MTTTPSANEVRKQSDATFTSNFATAMLLSQGYLEAGPVDGDLYGHMLGLAEYVRPICAAYDKANELGFDLPGCFDFEVTHPMGEWLRNHDSVTDFIVELGRVLDSYFERDCTLLVVAALEEVKGYVMPDVVNQYKELALRKTVA